MRAGGGQAPGAMRKITESEIEQFAIELFEKSDCQYIYAPSIAADLTVRVRMQTGSETLERNIR